MITIDKNFSTGTLRTTETVVINGRFEGKIDCGLLIIGPDGFFSGSAEADEVEVAGQLIGDVMASKIVFLSSAHVEAKLTYQHLSADPEAIFIGDFEKMKSKERTKEFLSLLEAEAAYEQKIEQQVSR